MRCIRDHLLISFACQKHKCCFTPVHNIIMNYSWCYRFFFISFYDTKIALSFQGCYTFNWWRFRGNPKITPTETTATLSWTNINGFISTRVSPTSTLICHENEAFRKRFLNRRNLKTLTLRFNADWKQFKTGSFRNGRRYDNHAIFTRNRSKMVGYCCLFWNFSLVYCGRKTFEAFSEWKRRFQISPAYGVLDGVWLNIDSAENRIQWLLANGQIG